MQVIVDEERELYARWGLGISDWWHVLSPSGLWSVVTLARGEGIKNRPTESGSRWQTAGGFGVDGEGVVRWAWVAERADDMGELEEGIRALKG